MQNLMKARGLRATMAAVGLLGTIWSGGFIPGVDLSLVTGAQAVVGRPLTPMSYAGVARRTVRRCAAGVYNC
jgi:hypothetical protein